MTTAFLNPGIALLFRVSRRLAYPTVITACITLYSPAPVWMIAPNWCLCVLVYLWTQSLLRRRRQKQEMGELGAVEAPVHQGKWPGNLDLMLQMLKQAKEGYPQDNVARHVREHGLVYQITIMGESRIVTSDPNHMKAILATDFQSFEKGDFFRRQMSSVLGTGVFNSDGDLWKFHRSMSRPFFSRDRISDFETFGQHADEALAAIRARAGAPIDVQDVLFRFTLDSATEFLLGSCVHSLYALLPPDVDGRRPPISVTAEEFGPALARVQHRLATRARTSPLWPLIEIFGDKTKKDMNIIRRFVTPIIDDALRRKRKLVKGVEHVEGTAADERQTLLDQLIDVTDDAKLIADETLNILLAGRDTTAGTLTFSLYFLASHPNVLKRLRDEILERVGSTRYPDFDDLKEMKYLRAFINETLRLFPAVPGNVRYSAKATVLPPTVPGGKPIYVPANSKTVYLTMAMQRNKDVWGPDAELFDPDRFLDDRVQKYLVPNPFSFIPFNAGPRICLGQQFAYNEMSFFLVRFLQAFDRIELAPDAQPAGTLPPDSWITSDGRKRIERIRPKSDLTMSVTGGLWVRCREAEKDV
ncbi:cytochrome P450 monooxygenase pc-1 [Wolfiporia cocos MD-104 SS10]|uniref:Cytochrome P450 monooxygenase pc-1 n=1 Tax=Wolfiporia cocos (strain MD-104) TaxID=742152 RepID=A0A2H3JEC9_WOLCO|nr:cytochrome P450 monooxygenase pc-1 [Wolfiporia cocos MD-104 SS10]